MGPRPFAIDPARPLRPHPAARTALTPINETYGKWRNRLSLLIPVQFQIALAPIPSIRARPSSRDFYRSRLHALRGASTQAFVNAPEPRPVHAEEVYFTRFLPFVACFAGEPQRYAAWTAYRLLAEERQLFALPVSAP